MKIHTLHKTTNINKSLPEVFAFFSKAENLDLITPPHLNFKILTPLPVTITKGKTIDYKLKLYGIPFGWTTVITEWNPPYSFQDSQKKGPYLQWIHTHSFKELNGKVEMTDKIEYACPGWFLEPFIHHFFVGPNVRKIFDYREVALKKLL